MIAVPVILQSLITTGVNLVDNIMLGQLTETALSGSTQALSLIHIFTQNQWDAPTFRCAAGNVVGEILFGTPSLARVFDYSRNGRVYVAAIVDAAQENSARCERLVQVCRETLRCKMTVYLGRPCSIAQLWERRLFWEQMDLDLSLIHI